MIEEKNKPVEELPVPGPELPENGNQEPEIEQLSTSNTKPQTKQMDVHHHGHVHHQKKWKEI